jgi:hypothetical protein
VPTNDFNNEHIYRQQWCRLHLITATFAWLSITQSGEFYLERDGDQDSISCMDYSSRDKKKLFFYVISKAYLRGKAPAYGQHT